MTSLTEKIRNFYQSKKLGILFALILVALGIGSYQIYQYYLFKKELTKIQPAASAWQSLENKERQFSLSFPGQPEKSEGTTSIEQVEVKTLSYRSLLDNGTVYSLYLVSYPDKVDLSDFDKNAKRLLKALFNTQTNTQITTVKKQIIENNPTLDINFTNLDGNIFNYRFILVNRDFYVLSTSSIKGTTAENEKLFDSLKIISKEEG